LVTILLFCRMVVLCTFMLMLNFGISFTWSRFRAIIC